MVYSNQQKAKCVLWFNQYQSPTRVQQEFRRTYGPFTRLPDQKSIKEWVAKFSDTGSVQRIKRTNTRYVRTDEAVQDVLELFAAEPHMSQRRAENE
uniref:DUF4817 domain-containing protein n=1 Tax=Panagrolaimus superbus TaxID=310955 RepID=A0A914Z5Z2_9BILA